MLAKLFQAHPWHGIEPGPDAPAVVNAYIEIVPIDAVKYELDKRSGHLRVDRPQRFSSLCPAPYGFIPQTFCGSSVAALCESRTGRQGIRGDGDPLDICVLTERPAAHGDFIVRALPIGGLRMIDGDEADDKIIAVLESDVAFGDLRDIADAPHGLVDRLRHYFLSYKQLPHEGPGRVEIAEVYDRDSAGEVIRRSVDDYRASFGAPETRLAELRRLLMDTA
ncbi:MAG: inorganic pyrophosphatase [Candidatus Rokubacteria bacterium]|nr:inorganic pyrophosphatase [Candidatus Rokubacteria bacterium]